MGLGRKFGSDADSSASVGASLFKVPAVPVGWGGTESGRATEQTETTRLLSAAAYLRPDSIAEFRDWRKGELARLKSAVTPEFAKRWPKEKRAAEKGAGAVEIPEKPQPTVVVGHDYVRWVRRRILAHRPVPSFGFELTPVVERCAAAEQLLFLRRALMTLAFLSGLVCIRMRAASWLPVVVLGGLWAACYLDRVLAHRRLALVTGGSIDSGIQARGWSGRRRRAMETIRRLKFGMVFPYIAEARAGGRKHHFVGAGRVWYEAKVGVDVMSSEPKAKDSGGGPEDRIPRIEDILQGGRSGPSGFREFTPDELLAHVVRQLMRATRPSPDFHPDNRLEAYGVAVISGDRWSGITSQQWDSLTVLAKDGPRAVGADLAPKVARQLLCARVVSWDGELVASIFVSFAYEDRYLSVRIRPHVMNPIHPRLRAADADAAASGWSWHRRAFFASAADVVLMPIRLFRPGRSLRRPELDEQNGPVSLREAYSARYMDDMLQYDDARRYIEMLERRVFTAVENFLVDHNVDIHSYKEQTTLVLQNSGVINYGEMGAVQNQPGAVNSEMSS